MLEALDHVLIGVRDLDAATDCYAGLLGLRPSWRGHHPGAGTANTLFRLDNTYIELISPGPGDGAGPDAELLEAWLAARGEGLLGLAFATGDVERCSAGLAERGLEPGPVQPGRGVATDSGAARQWRSTRLGATATRGVFICAIEHDSPEELLPRSSPSATPEAGCVTALDHAVVQSPDAEAAKRLYGEGLGLRLALDRTFEEWGMRLLFFRVGGVTVEIANAQTGGGANAATDANDAPDEDRLWGLCYRVPDADAAHARLSAAGFDVSDVRPGRRPGTRVLTVRSGTCGVPTLVLELGRKGDD